VPKFTKQTEDGKFFLPTQRGRDGYGSGSYMASRGSRVHKGIDIFIPPGYPVYAPRSGRINRVNWPVYSANTPEKKRMTLVTLIDKSGFEHMIMYVKAAQGLSNGKSVRAGDLIGYAQGLAYLYPGIGEHIHYQVSHGNVYFHPLDFSAMRNFLVENGN